MILRWLERIYRHTSKKCNGNRVKLAGCQHPKRVKCRATSVAKKITLNMIPHWQIWQILMCSAWVKSVPNESQDFDFRALYSHNISSCVVWHYNLAHTYVLQQGEGVILKGIYPRQLYGYQEICRRSGIDTPWGKSKKQKGKSNIKSLCSFFFFKYILTFDLK